MVFLDSLLGIKQDQIRKCFICADKILTDHWQVQNEGERLNLLFLLKQLGIKGERLRSVLGIIISLIRQFKDKNLTW